MKQLIGGALPIAAFGFICVGVLAGMDPEGRGGKRAVWLFATATGFALLAAGSWLY